MFAQLPTLPAGAIENWLVAGAAVMIILERGIAFWRNNLKEQPPPSATYVTREMCSRQHDSMTERLHALEQAEKESMERRRIMHDLLDRKTGELHDKVNRVDRATAGLQASLEQVNQRLSLMDAKVDRLIERR